MNKHSKPIKFIKIGTGVLSAVAGTAYASSKCLMKLAMDRSNHLLLMRFFSGQKSSGRRSSGRKSSRNAALRAASHRLAMEPHEILTISSSDGLALTAHWFPAENAKRVIVAMHGWRSSWTWDFGVITPFLRSQGCSVLYAEQRAQKNSEGRYMTFGILEHTDCIMWAEQAVLRAPGLPVYLYGVSMGASTVLMASGKTLPRNVAGIIADCGFTSPQAIWQSVVERRLHLPYVMGPAAERIFQKKVHVTSAYSATEALRHNTRPVLFIHGTGDTFVPYSMTLENHEACIAKKQLLLVDGAEHAASCLKAPDDYMNALQEFWDTCEDSVPAAGDV